MVACALVLFLTLDCSAKRLKPEAPPVKLEAALPPASLMAGPYLVGWAGDSMAVRYESAGTCQGTLRLRAETDPEFTDLPIHEVKLTQTQPSVDGRICQSDLPALASCTIYIYRLVTEKTDGPENRFRAPPPDGSTCPGGLKIAVIGDTRTKHDVHARLAERIRGFAPHLLLHPGDLVDHTDQISEWRKFIEVEQGIVDSAVFAVAPGNHEVLPNGEKSTLGAFLMNRYFRGARGGGTGHFAFDFGPVHIVVLDTYFGEQLDNGGMDWLKQRLASVPSDRLKFVLLHEPPVTFGQYVPGEELVYLRQVLLDNAVDAVLAGHQHMYEHFILGSTHFVTSGGGGAELYEVKTHVVLDDLPNLKETAAVYHYIEVEVSENRQVRFRTFDIDGRLVEEWTL